MKYILIKCVERDICVPKSFDTYEEAHDDMVKQLNDVLGTPEEYEEGSDYGIEEFIAWANVKDNYDWKIFEVTVEDSKTTFI